MEKTKYSKIYRIIHWAIAISFLLLLFTIFLRLTWMNKNNVAAIIQDYLSGTDQVLSQEQLISLAKKIRQPMWNWHIYIGYILTGLFSLRFILPIFGPMKFQNPFGKNLSIKEKFQKWTYIIFYLGVVISWYLLLDRFYCTPFSWCIYSRIYRPKRYYFKDSKRLEKGLLKSAKT